MRYFNYFLHPIVQYLGFVVRKYIEEKALSRMDMSQGLCQFTWCPVVQCKEFILVNMIGRL